MGEFCTQTEVENTEQLPCQVTARSGGLREREASLSAGKVETIEGREPL